MNLSLSRAIYSRMSLRSTLRLTKFYSSAKRRPHSNSSFQLQSRKLNSLAKVSRRESSKSSPALNSSTSKSRRHMERCSEADAFLSDTRSENSAIPCLDRNPRSTSVSTRFLMKRMSFLGLIRLLSLRVRIAEFVL